MYFYDWIKCKRSVSRVKHRYSASGSRQNFRLCYCFHSDHWVYRITRPGLSNKTLSTNHNANLGHRAPPTEINWRRLSRLQSKTLEKWQPLLKGMAFSETPLQLLPSKDILFLSCLRLFGKKGRKMVGKCGKTGVSWTYQVWATSRIKHCHIP